MKLIDIKASDIKKTRTEFLSEKSDTIDMAFSNLEAYLKGEKTIETDEIKKLKKIIKNYRNHNNLCYSQADDFFGVKQGKCSFYRQFSEKVQNWFSKLLEPFIKYEEKESTTQTQLAFPLSKEVSANNNLHWYLDPG